MPIKLTDEMRAAVKGRMGIPRGTELDPWMEAAVEDVLAIVGRDYRIEVRPLWEHQEFAERPREMCPYCAVSLAHLCPWHRIRADQDGRS
jgi:hypothetical protein